MTETVITEGVIRLDARDEGAIAGIKAIVAEVRADLDSLPDRENVEITASLTNLERKLLEAKAKVAVINKTDAVVNFKAQSAAFDREMEIIRLKIKKGEGALEKALDEENAGLVQARGNRLKKLRKEMREVETNKLALAIDYHQVREASEEVDHLGTSIKGLSKSVRELRTVENEFSKIGQHKFMDEVQVAKEEALIARLEKKYKDLSNTLDRAPRGVNRGPRFLVEKKNTEELIDRGRIAADFSFVRKQLSDLGNAEGQLGLKAREALQRAKVADNDFLFLERIGEKVGKLTSKFSELGKTRVNFGPFSSSVRGLVPVIGLLGSQITSVAGSLTSLVGVLGSGALGAAAVGGGVFAGLIQNLLGVRAALKPTAEQFELTTKAQTKYEVAIAKHGKGSEQAIKAHEELRSIIGHSADATEKLAVAYAKLKTQFRSLTNEHAKGDLTAVLGQGLRTAHTLLPGLAQNTNKSLDILRAHLDSIFAHLRKPAESKAFVQLGADANKFLNPALSGLERFGAGLLHIGEAAAHLFAGPLGKAVFNMGENFNKATKPGEELNKKLEGMVHSAENVWKFFKAMGKVIVDVLAGSTTAGNKFTESMTHAMERWDHFLKSTEGKNQLAAFFENARKDTETFSHVFGPIVRLFFEWSAELTPAATAVLKVAAAVSGFLTKLLGSTLGLKTVGIIIGSIFAAKKVGGFVSGVAGAITKVKELGSAIKNVGLLGAFKGLGKTGAGAEILASSERGAAAMGAAIVEGSTVGAERFAAAIEGASILGGPGGIPGKLGKGSKILGTAEKAALPVAEGVAGAAAADAAVTGVATTGIALAPETLGASVIAAAVIGGLILATKDSKTQETGKKAGEAFAKGMGPGFKEKFAQLLDEAEKPLREHPFEPKFTPPKNVPHGTLPHQGFNIPTTSEEATPAQRKAGRQAEQKNREAGKQIGKEAVQHQFSVVGGAQFSGAEKAISIINDLNKRFATLPISARRGAVEAAAELVKGLEAKKELPAKTLETMIHSLEHHFPGLKLAFAKGGVDSITALEQAFKSNKALVAIQNMVASFRNIFPQIPKIVGHNADEMTASFGASMHALLKLSHEGPALQRQAALEEYKKLKERGAHYFGELRHEAESEVKKLSDKLGPGIHPGATKLIKAFQNLFSVITKEVQSGVKSVAEGTEAMNRVFGEEAKALGVDPKAISKVAIKAVNTAGKAVGEFLNPSEHATGGLYQVGKPGERGRDTEHLIVGKGEQVAVFTHQQQQRANKELAHVGGLAGIFGDKRPHYMASGGVVPRMLAEARGIDAQHYNYEWGGGHGAGFTPAHGEGHGSGSGIGYDCSGAVSAVLHAGGLLNAPRTAVEFENYGMPGPGRVSIFASQDHVYMSILGKFFGTSGANPGGGAGFFPGSARAGFVIRHVPDPLLKGSGNLINTPKWKGPGGLIGSLGKAMLRKESDAANKKLNDLISKSIEGKVGGGNIGEGSGGGAAGNAQEKAWARAGLAAAGVSVTPGNVALIVARMIQESGGNPHSENTWDSNAKAGHPSRGLMELIPENFEKYHVAGTANNVFDPVANVAAAVRYMLARYHHLVGSTGQGYAEGGFLKKKDPGGKYDKPALLVGEDHRAEYVISTNPAYKDSNGMYLKDAGRALGYNVTPAKVGKTKPPKTLLSKRTMEQVKALELHDPDPFSSGGVPEGQIAKIAEELDTLLNSEKGKRESFQTKKDKDKKSLTAALKSKDYTTNKAKVKAVEGIENAKFSLGLAQGKKVTDTPAGRKAHAEGVTRAEHRVSAAESKAKGTVSSAEHSAIEKVLKVQGKLKEDNKALHALSHGGTFDHVKYIGIPKLEKDLKRARDDRNKVTKFNEEIHGLQGRISGDQAKLSNISKAYNRHPDPKLLKEWRSLMDDRKNAIGSVKGKYNKALKVAQDDQKIFHSAELDALIANLGEEVQNIENTEQENNEASEVGLSGAGAEPGAILSADEFVNYLGEAPALLKAETAVATSALDNIADNPNTPVNEEIPTLVNDRAAAKTLSDFWENTYNRAVGMGEPEQVIKDVAGQFSAARSSYLGLLSQITSGEQGQASQEYQEKGAFNSARLELLKNYGSNFATVLGGSFGKAVAPASSDTGGTTTNVHVTNNFSHPPVDPHSWSNGLAWELGAGF